MRKFLSIALFLLIGVCGASAQDQTGMIYGNVTNEDGAIISGATITAESPALIRPFETVTNARGRYVLPVLPVGTYRITVIAENYQGTALEDISISVNNRLRIDVVLKTGVVGEDLVVITGDAPLVDVTKTDTGMNISKELFDKLPKGRNFQSIVALAPGATDESDRFGGIMIDGASSSENVFVIDGAGTNDLIGGRNSQSAVFEFVEEVQVRSGGYEAEYGGSMGGVVNVVTRSGGNEFSGSLIGYYQADWLNADPRDMLRLNPFDGTNDTAEYFTPNKDDYSRYDIGGSLGGYVLKDKVWFFGSYMPYFDTQNRTVDFRDSNGTIYESRTYEQTQQQHNATGKISVQLTDKWNASVSGSTDWWKYTGQIPSGSSLYGTGNPDGYDPDYGFKYPGYVASARTDYFVSDDLYLSGSWGYHRTNTEILEPQGIPSDPRHYFYYTPRPEWNAMMPEQYRHSAGYFSYSASIVNQFVEDFKEQMSSSASASYFMELAGDHQWKTGFQTFWIHNRAANGDVAQRYYYYWDQTYEPFTNAGMGGRGEYGYIRILSYDGLYGLNGEASSYRYAMFLQDSYSPNDRLTINVGIRAESEKLPSYDENFEDPLDFGFGDKVAPRVGLSYDVTGDGTLKAFGNFGVYYDVMKLEMAREGYGGRVYHVGYYTLDSLEYWTFPNTTDPSAIPGTFLEDINWRIPALETTDPETEPMGIFEYIAGLDWQFADNQSVSVRFVYKTLRKAIEDVGIITDRGEEYWHGNPGFGATKRLMEENGFPVVEAVRDYTGFDIRYVKRYSNNWTGGANLTISRLKGNYSGLTNTDEGNRDSPNVNRNFDLWWQTLDVNWNQNLGILQSDRRYTATIFGSYLFDEGMLNGLSIGFQQIINDGAPFTTEVELNGIDGYAPYGRADQGRFDIITRTDLYAEYNLRLADSYTLNFNMNITNLFDQDGELNRYRRLNAGTANVEPEDMFNYYQMGQALPIMDVLNVNGIDSRFGMTNSFQSPRSIRLGAKLIF